MRRRLRTRRMLKWICTTVLVCLMLVWLGSVWWKVGLVNQRSGFALAVSHGSVGVLHSDVWGPFAADGWICERAARWAEPTVWKTLGLQWPAVHKSAGTGVLVPLWLPVLAVGVGATVLHRQRNRLRVGSCQHCGYDLTGNVSGRCPECGAAIEREGKPG